MKKTLSSPGLGLHKFFEKAEEYKKYLQVRFKQDREMYSNFLGDAPYFLNYPSPYSLFVLDSEQDCTRGQWVMLHFGRFNEVVVLFNFRDKKHPEYNMHYIGVCFSEEFEEVFGVIIETFLQSGSIKESDCLKRFPGMHPNTESKEFTQSFFENKKN